jgi:hypothetical protein
MTALQFQLQLLPHLLLKMDKTTPRTTMTWMQELPAFWEDAIDKHAVSGPWTRPLTSNL